MYHWKCRDHGQLVVREKPVVVPALPPPLPALPQKRVATQLPPDVKITRLPPGPVPQAQRSVSDSRTQCRLPGCPNRNSGPRFDLFCREHYAKLNAEERMKYKALWKTTHAPAPVAPVKRSPDSDKPYPSPQF
jgi:hypothetical protein